jgi:hypothetical protein
MAPSSSAFRNKAETCRSLMRHVTDERALRVLGEMIAENLAKAQAVETLAGLEAPRMQPSPLTRPSSSPDVVGLI